MRAFLGAAIALLLTGCATTSHTDTPTVDKPSGKPVMAVRASQAGVKSFIQAEMINAGYSIRKDSGSDKDSASDKDSGSELIFGKPLGVPADWGYVINYSLTEKPPTVRVVAEPRAVLHFGTPNETDYTNYSSYGERAKAQADAVLSGLKHKFRGTWEAANPDASKE